MINVDEKINQFSYSYPNIISSHQKNLWNFYRYGLSNLVHCRGLDVDQVASRAKELNKLPDGTSIVVFYIRQVVDRYKDRLTPTSSIARESEGTIETITDVAEARKDIIELTKPYLNNPLEESDFREVTTRFSSGSRGRKTETKEPKKRRASFASLVLKACRGNYKPGEVIFKDFLLQRMSEWDPRNYPSVWHLTSSVQFDSIIRIKEKEKIGNIFRTEIKIDDFDEKFIGNYALIPAYQWSKNFVYEEGNERFIFFEKSEAAAIEKGFLHQVGQPIVISVLVPNFEKLFPYIFDEDSLEYDGKIEKTYLKKKFVYSRKFNKWIYNQNLKTDSTALYQITV